MSPCSGTKSESHRKDGAAREERVPTLSPEDKAKAGGGERDLGCLLKRQDRRGWRLQAGHRRHWEWKLLGRIRGHWECRLLGRGRGRWERRLLGRGRGYY